MGKKTGPNPTDRGKGGVKRSLLTEARGIPVGLVLDGANRHDMKRTESTLASVPPAAEAARQAHLASGAGQGLCLDAGYDYAQVREALAAFGYTAHIRPRGEEVRAKKAGQQARRWGRPVGWSSAPIPGSTGFVICLFAKPKSRKTTWLCSILPAPESRGTIAFLGETNPLFG